MQKLVGFMQLFLYQYMLYQNKMNVNAIYASLSHLSSCMSVGERKGIV